MIESHVWGGVTNEYIDNINRKTNKTHERLPEGSMVLAF